MKYKPPNHHVSLQKFASRGSKGSQLQRKKEEDEVKRHKKSAALRKYAKLCKTEGIVSDRVNIDGVKRAPATSDEGEGGEEGEAPEGPKQVEKQKQKQKQKVPAAQNAQLHPFMKAERTASKTKEAKAEADAERLKVQQEVNQSQKIRDEKRKLHMKRTKKGQPVLNNTMKSLLAKIQAQQ